MHTSPLTVQIQLWVPDPTRARTAPVRIVLTTPRVVCAAVASPLTHRTASDPLLRGPLDASTTTHHRKSHITVSIVAHTFTSWGVVACSMHARRHVHHPFLFTAVTPSSSSPTHRVGYDTDPHVCVLRHLPVVLMSGVWDFVVVVCCGRIIVSIVCRCLMLFQLFHRFLCWV